MSERVNSIKTKLEPPLDKVLLYGTPEVEVKNFYKSDDNIIIEVKITEPNDCEDGVIQEILNCCAEDIKEHIVNCIALKNRYKI